MFPFNYSTTFEYPLSDDVSERVTPLFGDNEGNPKVARHGKPMDKVTEAILELAEKAGVDAGEIEAVRQITAGAKAAELRAREALQD